MKKFKLKKAHTGIVIIDIQEKLMPAMEQKQRVVNNIINLLHLSKQFDLPVVITEHYPKGLGTTLPEVREFLTTRPIEKVFFNCCDVEEFNNILDSHNLENVILTGVESHICVFQTCLSLLEKGYNVHVPLDAIDSRVSENWQIGLDLMKDAGAVITSTETVIYQILERAGTKEFKEMLRLIK